VESLARVLLTTDGALIKKMNRKDKKFQINKPNFSC
jgi:hypothetical protein